MLNCEKTKLMIRGAESTVKFHFVEFPEFSKGKGLFMGKKWLAEGNLVVHGSCER